MSPIETLHEGDWAERSIALPCADDRQVVVAEDIYVDECGSLWVSAIAHTESFYWHLRPRAADGSLLQLLQEDCGFPNELMNLVMQYAHEYDIVRMRFRNRSHCCFRFLSVRRNEIGAVTHVLLGSYGERLRVCRVRHIGTELELEYDHDIMISGAYHGVTANATYVWYAQPEGKILRRSWIGVVGADVKRESVSVPHRSTGPTLSNSNPGTAAAGPGVHRTDDLSEPVYDAGRDERVLGLSLCSVGLLVATTSKITLSA
jgi:hypothetical protein